MESISSTLVSPQLFDLIEINFRILFVCQRDVCACVCVNVVNCMLKFCMSNSLSEN